MEKENLSYEEIKAEIEDEMTIKYENEYKNKYLSFSDAHTNMSHRMNCLKAHLKCVTLIKEGERSVIPREIRCPNIPPEGYMNDFLQYTVSKCSSCSKYK